MELRNTIFAILAVFCVVLSACAVSAADDVAGDFNATDGQEIHDDMILPPDYAHSEMNATNATADAVGNAAGENATSANATNATAAHTMHATGNPILALLAVGAVLGGYAVIRRK